MTNRSEIGKQQLLEEIISASRSRPVIPFIGSGVSISAGYPTIKLVIQYLAKVDFAIRFGVFQDRFPLVKGGVKFQTALVESYRQHPSTYLEDFGWPNLGQLDADLWGWLNRSREKKYFKISGIEGEGYHRIWCDSIEQYIKTQNFPDDEYKVIISFIKIIERGDSVEEDHEIFGLLESVVEKQKIINSIAKLLDRKKRNGVINQINELFIPKEKSNYDKNKNDEIPLSDIKEVRTRLKRNTKEENEVLKLFELLQKKQKKNYSIKKILKLGFEENESFVNKTINLFVNEKNESEKNARKQIIDLLSNDVTTRPITHKTKSQPLDSRDHLHAIVQWTLRQELANHEYGTEKPTIKEWLEWKTWYHNKIKLYKEQINNKDKKKKKNTASVVDCIHQEPDLLFGDWEGLLDKLCEGNFDLADTLFNELEKGLNPALSHRLLAFLQPKLGMPLVLTTNFDSLLERAFREERLKPKIFDVHRDVDLPTPELVRNQLSILKLHGSAYGLRFGERLKQKLETDARNDALQYLPENALILVIGFSGSERRMMQMLQAFVQKNTTACLPKLIWIQGPSAPGPLFDELVNGTEDGVKWCKVRHADTFLQELYFKIANSHQSTRKQYSSLPGQLRMAEVEPKLPERIDNNKKLKRCSVQCFFADDDKRKLSGSWATLAGVAFTNSLDFSYKVIWIDLEYHQTIEGVIAEFFSQVRVVDPQAPNYIISNLSSSRKDKNKNKREIIKAIDRIREVFQRGRYVLVLDSLEFFGRPPLIHHGISSIKADKSINNKNKLFKEFAQQTSIFYNFLKKLLLINFQRNPTEIELDYYIVVTVEKPHSRHGTSTRTIKLVKKNISRLQKNLENKESYIHLLSQTSDFEYKDFYKKNKTIHPPSAKLEKYWRYRSNNVNLPKKRYIKRAISIISLLKELRPEIFGVTFGEHLSEKKSISALISLLSFFRRPRTIPMIRSITTRWVLRNIYSLEKKETSHKKADEQVSDIAHEKVAELLEKITFSAFGMVENPIFSQRHEGGSIWLYREIHENSYDALTEHLHIQKWNNTWNKLSGKKGAYKKEEISTASVSAIMDGMVFISWHLSIARTYYVDVFMPTQDIKAFYEYLYHRVTAIRTIVLLINISDKTDDWDGLKKEFDDLKLRRSDEQPDSFSLYANLVGIFSQIPKDEENLNNPTKGDFIQKLQELHINSLETLLAALERNELLFLAQSTPDAVLSWSKQFLNYEFSQMGNVSPVNKKVAKKKKAFLKENKDATKIIKYLEEFFLRLQFKAKMSKFDFNGIYLSELAECNQTTDSSFSLVEQKKNLVDACEEKLSASKKGIEDLEQSNDKKNIQEKVDDLQRKINKFLRKARCLIYFNFNLAYDLAEVIQRNSYLKNHPSIVALHRDAVALKGKAYIAQWPLWKPLLDREVFSDELIGRLKEIEDFSIEYEDTLRLTTKTKSEDALHRSSSFALRARSLYLQGHFSEAHHFLDIGSTSLLLERVDHRTNACIIHLVRAELLAMSADNHYPLDKEFKQEKRQIVEELKAAANTSLKKINRAEQELYQAEELLHDIAHEKMWLISVEFGWAQVRLERMLFEMELLFLESRKLNKSEYLQKSGALEQLILETMQRLRNVLDMIPYSSNPWEGEKKTFDDDMKDVIDNQKNIKGYECDDVEYHYPTVAKIERMSYRLWKQLFVAGAYYTGLLSEQYKNFDSQNDISNQEGILVAISHLNGVATTGSDAQPYQERWKLWCNAMRFKRLGEEVKLSISLAPNEDSSLSNTKKLSLRATVIESMKNECSSEKINEMWNARKVPLKNRELLIP